MNRLKRWSAAVKVSVRSLKLAEFWGVVQLIRRLKMTRGKNKPFVNNSIDLISGDAGAYPDVRDSGRLVVESAAVLLRPRGGRRAEQVAEEKVREVGKATDILFLQHDSSILRQSSGPVCGFFMMDQFRLCCLAHISLAWLFRKSYRAEPGFSVTYNPSNDPICQKIAKNVISEKPN